ncbi:Nuclear pore membrane glycoprotein 210 [Nymphon striatum]|nr:Nuclear pore membrane glycoprotein 210 [Nymphon striatum]
MMAASSCTITFLLLFTYLIVSVNASKLNVPRVLLPFKTSISTNYTLEVTEGGCYRWTSSRPEVAIVTPVLGEDSENECSTRAIVTAVSTTPSRQSTIILATDEGSDTVLKCDVIIDTIHTLEVVTTTRELFLDDAPEAFEVHAKNDQEDTFTSIEGLAFDWQLESKGSSTNTVLRCSCDCKWHYLALNAPWPAVPDIAWFYLCRFLTFEASPYETVPSVDYWEKQGLKGYIVLVEGIGTGAAAVSVTLNDPKFKDVKRPSITLIVVANLMLNPAHDVYLLPDCHVQYKVELIKQGRPHEIKMPSDQYYLEVKNSDTVHLDSSRSDVTGLSIGSTTILLNDKRFDVRPGSNWVLQTSNRYEISVRLYSLDNREIYPSDNIRIKVTFPEKYFKIEHSSENGTFHVVHTRVHGRTKLTGKLVAIVKSDGTEVKVEEQVENDQLVEIYDKLSIKPKLLAYPWDPVSKPSYSGQLNLAGGSGSYTWKSSNPSIVQIKKDGSFSTLKPGVVQITAFDSNNKLHYDTAEIAVLEVAGMDILPSPVEAMVDNQLFIPLTVYGFRDKDKSKKLPFEDCSKLKIGVEFVDRRFFVYEEDQMAAPYPGACRTLIFTAKYQGYSRIFVTHGTDFKTTAVIAGFKNLQPHNPASVAVLALGTSREIAFEGGPRAWVLKEDSHYTTLTIQKKSAVDSVLVKDPYRHNVDLYVFRVSCKQIYETEMNLKVGNEPSVTNTMPASQDVRLRTACEIPKKITLKIVTKECKSKKSTCPVSQDVVKIPVLNYEDIQIETRIIDSSGRKMQNVSSFEFEWSLSDPNLGKLSDDKDVVTEINGVKGFRRPVRHYQDFHPRGHQGLVTISVKITGYKKSVLEKMGITSFKDFKPLSASIGLELVETLEVDSEKVSVFNHPDNKVLIKILKGSGHFLIEQTDDTLAQITYNEELSAVEVVPKSNGMMSVSIYDACACMQVSARVKISGIHTIEVQMSNKVELGKNTEAKVNVRDEEGNILSVSLFSLINLEPVIGSKIISIKPTAVNEQGATFVVHGDSLGHTTLQFQATSNNKVVSNNGIAIARDIGVATLHYYVSETLETSIEVFPQFKLFPKNVTLLIGAVFQVSSIGGPEPQLNIEFNIKNKDIASVSNAGIIKASAIGITRIIGNVICGDSSDSTAFSKDEVRVHVVRLHGIKLHIPLTRIKTNSEIAIYVLGLNEPENPFSFGTADPPLKINWIISNSDIAVLLPTYHKVPIHSKQHNNFAMRLLTRKQGQVTVRVEVNYDGSLFTDEIQLHIFEDLRTKVSNQEGLSILMTPLTETYIKTNRDNLAQMDYKVYAEPINGLITVDSHSGKLISSDKTGEAIVQVIATESFGVVQKIAVAVTVKPVAYLMVSADTKIHSESGSPLETIPLGLNMKFTVGFYDNIGRKFDATSSIVKHRPCRYDLLQISHGLENNTLIVHAFKKGQTILKVWDSSNPRISDYIMIDVDSAVFPAVSQLTLGDVVCFSSRILSDNGHPGFWYTTGDVHVLKTVQDNGIAIARDIGVATLHYNVSETLETSIEVAVKPIKFVRITNLQPNFISNDITAENYNVTVMLLTEIQSKYQDHSCSSSLFQSDNFLGYAPFVCDISFTNAEAGIEAREIFSVMAVYNPSIVFKLNHRGAPENGSSGDFSFAKYPEAQGLLLWTHCKGIGWKGVKDDRSRGMEKGHYQCQLKAIPSVSSGLRHQLSTLVTDIALTVRVMSQGIHQKEITSDPVHILFLPQFVVNSDNLILSSIQSTNNVMITSSKLLSGSITVTKCMPQMQKSSSWLGFFQNIFSSYQNWFVTTLSIIGTVAALFISYRAVWGHNGNTIIHTNAFLPPQPNLNSSGMSHGSPSAWMNSSFQRSSPSARPYLYSVDRSPAPDLHSSYRPYSSSFEARERSKEAYS